MNYKYRRFMALIIDLLLVSFLTICITNVSYINPYIYDVEEASKNYDKVYKDVSKIQNDDDILEFMNNIQGKLHDLEHTQIYVYLWYLIFYFAYFVVFAYFTKGKTLGKKLMHLTIVDNNKHEVSFLSLFLRSLTNGSTLFMGTNMLVIAKLISVTLLPANNLYFIIYMTLASLFFIMEIINILLFIFNKDNKCLNDFISHSKVISTI